jgi:hypothetical protein
MRRRFVGSRAGSDELVLNRERFIGAGASQKCPVTDKWVVTASSVGAVYDRAFFVSGCEIKKNSALKLKTRGHKTAPTENGRYCSFVLYGALVHPSPEHDAVRSNLRLSLRPRATAGRTADRWFPWRDQAIRHRWDRRLPFLIEAQQILASVAEGPQFRLHKGSKGKQ